MRTENLLGSKVGRLAMASTSPVARVERHHGALAAFHRQFGHGLQVQIDA